ncbi:C1 family peptidase [Taibaiella koreensis]|uniref:C1 family peptidase n=1 Tax=Taibaiella koreensis TaxID=1268548 RepID=UPI000E59CD8E|nr:C1 family peptidase [Taibaiella koreensis]
MSSGNKFKMGWIPDLPDPRDTLFSASAETFKALPGYINLRDRCGPVLDQETLGSCTANAAASAFRFDLQKQGAKVFDPSRLFIYYNTREAMGTVDEDRGASLRETVKSMNKLGVCGEKAWPYKIDKFSNRPGAACFKSGRDNQVLQYKKLDNTSLIQLKGCLAEGYPFIFGFRLWDSFGKIGSDGMMPMPGPGESPSGGHAVMAVGYDDIRQVFVIRNSWNETWGDKGYFYMPYAFISDTGYAQDFWTIRLVEEAPVANQPELATLKAAPLKAAADVVFRIKQALLYVAGNTAYDPNRLEDSYKLEYFNYNDMQWNDLAQRLTAIKRSVTPGAAAITRAAVSDCTTVGDCVALV